MIYMENWMLLIIMEMALEIIDKFMLLAFSYIQNFNNNKITLL